MNSIIRLVNVVFIMFHQIVNFFNVSKTNKFSSCFNQSFILNYPTYVIKVPVSKRFIDNLLKIVSFILALVIEYSLFMFY